MQKIKDWLSEWGGLILGGVLILAGILGYRFLDSVLLIRMSEGLFVAGILTIAVDPFLKKRLLKESGRDIFHHLLGFGLPPAIQDRIKETVISTGLYRKDMEMTVSLEEDRGQMRLDCEIKFEVINPGGDTKEFQQILQFEKYEYPKLKGVRYSERGSYGKNAQLKPMTDEQVLEFVGTRIPIPANDRKRHWFFAEFSVVHPSPGFHVQNFGQPTIGFTLRVRNKPTGYNVTATPADKQADDIWIYSGVFMPQEHIQIRWEKE